MPSDEPSLVTRTPVSAIAAIFPLLSASLLTTSHDDLKLLKNESLYVLEASISS